MGTGDRRVFDLGHSGAESLFISRCCRHEAILVSKTLEINGKVGVVCGDFYVGVTVTDQIGDAVHADVDLVAVQLVKFAIEFSHFGLEALSRNVVESIGVARRQLARQILKIFVPLFFGKAEPP